MRVLHVVRQMPLIHYMLFSIPAGPAGQQVVELATEAHVSMFSDPRVVANQQTHPVHGTMTVPEAFTMMLEGTGLVCLEIDEYTYVIRQPPLPSPGKECVPKPPKWTPYRPAAKAHAATNAHATLQPAPECPCPDLKWPETWCWKGDHLEYQSDRCSPRWAD